MIVTAKIDTSTPEGAKLAHAPEKHKSVKFEIPLPKKVAGEEVEDNVDIVFN